jgi:hypothetical protein
MMEIRMTLLARLVTCIALLAWPMWPAYAEPAAPWTATGIKFADFGIYCPVETGGVEIAPETSLGYIHKLSAPPVVVFHQQQVPARLGVHFGVIVQSLRDIPEVRNVTWLPGAKTPEVWMSQLSATRPLARGFSFETESELVTGLWRMEAYDGDTLLYSIEWEVLPPDALPGIGSDCEFVS